MIKVHISGGHQHADVERAVARLDPEDQSKLTVRKTLVEGSASALILLRSEVSDMRDEARDRGDRGAINSTSSVLRRISRALAQTSKVKL